LSSDPGDRDWAARNRRSTAMPPTLVVPGFHRKRSEFAPAGDELLPAVDLDLVDVRAVVPVVDRRLDPLALAAPHRRGGGHPIVRLVAVGVRQWIVERLDGAADVEQAPAGERVTSGVAAEAACVAVRVDRGSRENGRSLIRLEAGV
jgi:hypothetical protein